MPKNPLSSQEIALLLTIIISQHSSTVWNNSDFLKLDREAFQVPYISSVFIIINSKICTCFLSFSVATTTDWLWGFWSPNSDCGTECYLPNSIIPTSPRLVLETSTQTLSYIIVSLIICHNFNIHLLFNAFPCVPFFCSPHENIKSGEINNSICFVNLGVSRILPSEIIQ